MKIINKVTDSAYTQWIEKFVQDVLMASGLYGDEVVIEDIEPSRHIFLTVDGLPHTIRTWNYIPVQTDKNGDTCAEDIEYTMFQIVEDETGSHGEEVDAGTLTIEWTNEENENPEESDMNNTIEAIKEAIIQREHVEVTDLFELVNQYLLTMVSVNDGAGNSVLTMDVNYFEETCDNRYEFRQTGTTTKYTVNAAEITDVVATYIPEGDAVSIVCELKNGGELHLYIYKIGEYKDETTVDEDYHEIDVDDFKMYMGNLKEEKTYLNLKIFDVFGFRLNKPLLPALDYLEEDDNGEYYLNFCCTESTDTLKISVADGSKIYMKRNENSDYFIIKPYGMPFTEVSFLCL